VSNSGTKLHGKNGAIYLGGAKGGGGTKVAVKAAWTLQRNRDYVDATVFGDQNKTYLAGLPNVQGTFAGFLDVSGDLMLLAAVSDSQLIYLYADDDPNSNTSEIPVAHGSGLIDGTVDCSNADGVRLTGEFRADGPWTIDLGA
jgi:hypothetical protein